MASTGHSVTRYSACARMHARDQRWRQGALPPPPMGRYCGYAEIASLQPRARALSRVCGDAGSAHQLGGDRKHCVLLGRKYA